MVYYCLYEGLLGPFLIWSGSKNIDIKVKQHESSCRKKNKDNRQPNVQSMSIYNTISSLRCWTDELPLSSLPMLQLHLIPLIF